MSIRNLESVLYIIQNLEVSIRNMDASIQNLEVNIRNLKTVDYLRGIKYLYLTYFISDSGSYIGSRIGICDHFSIFHDVMPAFFLFTHVC